MHAPALAPITVLLLTLCGVAQPQQIEPVQLPPVSATLKRDASAFPYKPMNTVLAKLERYGEGLVRMDFRVDREKSGLLPSELRLVVRSDEADHPIRIGEDGVFSMPVLTEAESASADLATNVPKGSLHVRGMLELNLKPEQLDMARVRQLMRVARRLREELLPWYARLLFPRIEAVRICSASPGWELEWREQGQLLGLPLPVAIGEQEPDRKKNAPARPCTLLTGQESWPDAAKLVPPPDTRISVKY